MCGIIACKGSRPASSLILKGLRNLEYRGYDSVGIATVHQGGILLKKDVGKIGAVDDVVDFDCMDGRIGIGHTRWATTGSVTRDNAHPHLSQDGSVAVVHNGIIENFRELREFLVGKGFTFKGQTDTEVIPNLVEYHHRNSDLRSAFKKTLEALDGSFAIVLINIDEDRLYFARRGSPLVLGIADDEYFLASDVPAFLESTKNVVYLEEDQYGIIGEQPEIFDINTDQKIEPEIKQVAWSLEQAKKGDYPHFMLKEINEQPEAVLKAINQDPALMAEVTDMIDQSFGLFFVACGTSYHAAVSASYIFAHIAKKHVNVVLASEFRNYSEFLTPKTVMISISQSGETADLLDAVKVAKRKNVKVVSIVNVMGSTLTRTSDLNIMMNCGPEICVLSTKSYTAQLAVLIYLAYSVAGKKDEARALIRASADEIKRIIADSSEAIEDIAERIKDRENLFLIGRDLAFPSALEGALKIKEVSYIHAEGFAGGELKHGTIALIEEGTPCIVLATKATRALTLSNAEEVKARGGFIIGIGEDFDEVYDVFIEVKDLGNANPVAMIVPIQLLSYCLALKRGCSPDTPRNLAKSVTVR